MKRIGHIFDQVADMENLRLAFWKASRGKRCRNDQRHFAENLEQNLHALRDGLWDGSYPVGNYKRFTIFEPKERMICAASFEERVLHHALMNVCSPYIEKWLIYDTYACRVGKGQLRAVHRAWYHAGRHRWFLKCDFRKFFDSVPHDRLQNMLRRRFKDGRLLDWFEKLIQTYETEKGRGLPIGNLTSQHFANLYLDSLDRLVTSGDGMKFAYVRYMDDFVLWSDDKETLKSARRVIMDFAETFLGLSLKGEPFVNRTDVGMDFLGTRIFPKVVRLSRASRRRYEAKVAEYTWLLSEGVWDARTYQNRMTALTAFTENADSRAWRRKIFGKTAIDVGVEQEHPRWELEQQRQQPPVRQQELEQPVQQQQQQRLPRRPALSTANMHQEQMQSPPSSCSLNGTKKEWPCDAGSKREGFTSPFKVKES